MFLRTNNGNCSTTGNFGNSGTESVTELPLLPMGRQQRVARAKGIPLSWLVTQSCKPFVACPFIVQRSLSRRRVPSDA